MNRIYDISLELDILCPESDSMKLVLGSLVKKSFKRNISLNMPKIIFYNIFFLNHEYIPLFNYALYFKTSKIAIPRL